MTRPAAFSLARQRVKETGKPWLVVLPRGCPPRREYYEARSSYDSLGQARKVAWISVTGAEKVYDGLEAPASEETTR